MGAGAREGAQGALDLAEGLGDRVRALADPGQEGRQALLVGTGLSPLLDLTPEAPAEHDRDQSHEREQGHQDRPAVVAHPAQGRPEQAVGARRHGLAPAKALDVQLELGRARVARG